MKDTRLGGRVTLVAAAGIGLIMGCSGGAGGSLVYDAGFAIGSVIDALLIQPSLTPQVDIEVVQTDPRMGTAVLKANATSDAPPLTYLWEQLGVKNADISSPTEDTTQILLPVGMDGVFSFQVTVTDASNRQTIEEVQVEIRLGSG